MSTTIPQRFLTAGHTAAEWAASNPVLLDREEAFETDTRKIKFGDGVTAWNSLPYAAGSTPGAWASWTPTWTNLTVGNGTVVARYDQLGKTVHCRLSLVFGSTTAITGGVIFSLPVTRAAYGGTNGITPLGTATLFDTPGAAYLGTVQNLSTTTARIRALNAAGTYLSTDTLSATVPFTWAVGDEIAAEFVYEAA